MYFYIPDSVVCNVSCISVSSQIVMLFSVTTDSTAAALVEESPMPLLLTPSPVTPTPTPSGPPSPSAPSTSGSPSPDSPTLKHVQLLSSVEMPSHIHA